MKVLPFVCGVKFVNRICVCIQNSEANMVIVPDCLSYELLLSFPIVFHTGIHIFNCLSSLRVLTSIINRTMCLSPLKTLDF